MGWSCHIPYAWEAGRRYRLRVGTDEAGWWAASVTDDESGVVSPIGRIRLPAAVTGLGSWSVMWTEYYGPSVAKCSDLATARAVFGTPVAGTARPERRHSHLGELAGPHLDHTTCDTSSIEDLPAGARHQMGGRTPPG
ncbi:MAG TPA: hypothetical protein VF244_00500 [Acidimicrobiales bacterium]